MANLTITISDELYTRMEQWRDRINISQVCEKALAKETHRLEKKAAHLASRPCECVTTGHKFWLMRSMGTHFGRRPSRSRSDRIRLESAGNRHHRHQTDDRGIVSHCRPEASPGVLAH